MILIITLHLNVGGAESHLVRILPELKSRGHDVSVFTLYKKGPLASVLESAGIEVIEPFGATILKCLPTLLNKPLSILAFPLSFFRALFRLRPKILHFFLPEAYLAAGLVSLLTYTPIRIMSRRSMNTYQRKHPFAARIEKWLHKYMTAILGNSMSVVHQLKAEGVKEERLGLIYNGINLTPFEGERRSIRLKIRQQYNISNSSTVLTIVANLIPYKGHIDLLHALGLICNKMPVDWKLLIIGRDDGIGDDLAVLVEELGISKHVCFLGLCQDVSQLLMASDIGVLCSHEEGFSNALLEGMAAALPMVVTDVGGNAEAIVEGNSGLVVPSKSPEKLGDALLQLATNKELAQRMGDNAYKRVRQYFSLDVCVDRYEEFYQALKQGKPVIEMPNIYSKWNEVKK